HAWALRPIQQQIRVAASGSFAARMESVAYLSCPLDRDGAGQESIDAAHPRGQLARRGGIEMSYLTERMYTRVGSARALRADRVSGYLRERRVHSVLDRASRGLLLPAAKAAAVVFQAKGKAHVDRAENEM